MDKNGKKDQDGISWSELSLLIVSENYSIIRQPEWRS